MPDIYGTDAYSPPEIAQRIEAVGVKKAKLPLLSLFCLAVLAGGFIALGAMFYTVVASDPGLGFAAQRLLGGLVFCLGLILVVIAGAELFTGNNLMVMAWVDRKITARLLWRNLVIAYLGNFVGAAGIASLVMYSGHLGTGLDRDPSDLYITAMRIAAAKCAMPFAAAFFKGVLCNLLVCLAVWLAMAARSVEGKILAILFPITAFVAAGFEHCVANMYFVPLGIFIEAPGASWSAFVWKNLLPVTLGNLFGGAGMVGLIYYLIYLRGEKVQGD